MKSFEKIDNIRDIRKKLGLNQMDFWSRIGNHHKKIDFIMHPLSIKQKYACYNHIGVDKLKAIRYNKANKNQHDYI